MIQDLEWDSKFWNLKIADCKYENDYEIIEYLNKKKFDLIQSKVNINNTKVIFNLENLQFRFVDLNITYFMNLYEQKIIPNNKIMIANKTHISDIENIASKVFKHSRYNIIDRDKTKKFYKIWCKKSILGKFDDICLIEKDKTNRIQGFITIKKVDKNTAKIGLLGVDPIFQNKSVGTKLINQVKNYLAANNIKKLFVSTQGSNIIAQNFYIKNKFKIYDVSVWLYLFSNNIKNNKMFKH